LVVGGNLRTRDEQDAVARQPADVGEILQRVVARLLLDEGIDGHRRRVGHADGVAVGIGALDALRAERSARADRGIEHDGLAGLGLDQVGHLAQRDIDAGVGGQRQHQRDGPRWIRLGGGLRGHQAAC
jgi:hypothetical protein